MTTFIDDAVCYVKSLFGPCKYEKSSAPVKPRPVPSATQIRRVVESAPAKEAVDPTLMTKKELLATANRLGVKVSTNMNKDTIAKAINAAEQAH